MSTVALYELAAMRDILDQWLEESEGELTPELAQMLDDLEGQTTEKIERVALWIREQLALAAGIKEEEARLAARRKARENAAERMKTYLHQQLDRLGKDKVQGLLCTVALQNNPPSVQGELSQEQMDALYASASPCVRFIPASYALDKKAVLDAAKRGAAIPDGLVIAQTRGLRIR